MSVLSARPAAAQAPAEGAGELASHVAAWRAQHGPAWQALAHADTGRLEFLYGGSAAPSRMPVADADFALLALEAVAQTRAMHGIAPEELTAPDVHFLPLAQIGSTDKISVSLVQTVGGLPVRHGTVHCLFDLRGRLLSLHARGVAEAGRIDLTPLVPAARARAIAAAALAADEREVATWIGEATLELVRANGGSLAWRVEARNEFEGAMPAGRAYWIDARDGTVLDSRAHRARLRRARHRARDDLARPGARHGLEPRGRLADALPRRHELVRQRAHGRERRLHDPGRRARRCRSPSRSSARSTTCRTPPAPSTR